MFCIVLILSSLGQNIQMSPANIKAINAEHHGLSFVNFYNTCTDNVCTDNVKNLKPRVIRFPSAGDADMYIMNVDSPGYGIEFSKVAAYLADRYNSVQNPLTYTPLVTTYTCPLIFDPQSLPLKYNASTSVFTSTAAASSYTNDLQTWYCNYRRQKTQITQSYLTKFIQYVKEMEDSLQTGECVNVIYVANIFSGSPADLVKTLNHLTKASLNGIKSINVVGVELSNESWGKANNDIFPDLNAGDEFYNYVRGFGPPLYNGCLTPKGDYISALRSNFPNIKIGYPTAPMAAATHTDYYGCSMASSTAARFNTWNTQVASNLNTVINITVASTPTTATCGDAFVIHKYFDDKYWGNNQEGMPGSSCNNCLVNSSGPFQYKNYLRAHTTNSTSFNHAYSYYPNSEDDTLRLSFDCQLKETFKFIDSGFVDKVMDGYRTQLGINASNPKKIWMTEWNILENNNDDTTYLFHNTFNHAVLIMGWKMAMFRTNWEVSGAGNFLEYSTFFNGVSQQQNGCLSKRTATGLFGDGSLQDAGSGNVKRMAYEVTKLMRHISLDSLRWIDNTAMNIASFPNTRFYTFVDQSNKYIYLYYINADNTDLNLSLDSIKLNGYNLDSTVRREYFSVRNNYSAGGFSQQFEHNKFYKVGNNWQSPLTNESSSTYTQIAMSTKQYVLNRKSMGYIKIPIKDVSTGVEVRGSLIEEVNFFPNPSNGFFTVSSPIDVEASIEVSDIFGKTVLNSKMSGNKHELNLNGLVNGVYFISVYLKNQTVNYKLILLK